MKTLDGRIAVVTGAAHGIGAAVAEALAAQGCDLALVDVDAQGLESTARRVEEMGRQVSRHRVDVAHRAAMERLPGEVVARHGAVHVLVANAGVVVSKTLEEQSFDDLDWVIGTNLWGVLHACKVFLPHLVAADEGHIVTVSSMLAQVCTPRYASYCATKAAIRAFSESLAAELAPTRVGVSCVFPGTVRTNIVQAARVADERGRPNTQRRMDRYGTPPEKVAGRIVGAIRRGEFHVVVGAEARVTDWLKRLAPEATARFIARSYRKRMERRQRRSASTQAPQGMREEQV